MSLVNALLGALMDLLQFFVVMFVIILVECAALGLSIRYRSELQGFVEKEMRVGLEKYDNEPSVRSEFDAFQERVSLLKRGAEEI